VFKIILRLIFILLYPNGRRVFDASHSAKHDGRELVAQWREFVFTSGTGTNFGSGGLRYPRGRFPGGSILKSPPLWSRRFRGSETIWFSQSLSFI
jgi:hypothetical protein